VTVPGGKSAAIPVMWVAGAIAVLALMGAGTWLAYPVLLKRFRPETPVVTAPVQPPVAEVVKEPEAPGPGPSVQPPETVAPPVDRGDGGREAEARRNAERLAAERAASERAAAERAAAERAAAERLAQERVAAERLARERAEQARLAREAEEKQQAARRAAVPVGPRSGVLTWQGRLVKGEVVTITGTSASTGEVSGVALPGGAVLLQSGSGCTVSSAPVPSSGFKQFSFRCKQAGAVTAEFQWNKP
jgi:ribosomal protein S8E